MAEIKIEVSEMAALDEVVKQARVRCGNARNSELDAALAILDKLRSTREMEDLRRSLGEHYRKVDALTDERDTLRELVVEMLNFDRCIDVNWDQRARAAVGSSTVPPESKP